MNKNVSDKREFEKQLKVAFPNLYASLYIPDETPIADSIRRVVEKSVYTIFCKPFPWNSRAYKLGCKILYGFVKIIEFFPPLRQKKAKAQAHMEKYGPHCAVLFGVECGPGWYDLIWEISMRVESQIRKLPKEDREYIVVNQIKEKFGTLRFYISSGTNKIYRIISAGEKMSRKICETCGKPGKLRGRGWLYTACDEHTNKEDLVEIAESELS